MLLNKRGRFYPMTTDNDRKDNIETSNKYQYNRRGVVELDYLGEQLFYHNCSWTLRLNDIIKETKAGLASELSIRCHNCQYVKVFSLVNLTKQEKRIR